MELFACTEGVKAVMTLGIRDIVLETDAIRVVEAILGDEFRLSILGGVVHDLKELLAENFTSTQVKFVPRECNQVAHELASIWSLGTEGMPSVMAGVPDCIMYLVSSDLAGSID